CARGTWMVATFPDYW
nr:immunoglobulin heavy chain junction region [Macaca mulatta]